MGPLKCGGPWHVPPLNPALTTSRLTFEHYVILFISPYPENYKIATHIVLFYLKVNIESSRLTMNVTPNIIGIHLLSLRELYYASINMFYRSLSLNMSWHYSLASVYLNPSFSWAWSSSAPSCYFFDQTYQTISLVPNIDIIVLYKMHYESHWL